MFERKLLSNIRRWGCLCSPKSWSKWDCWIVCYRCAFSFEQLISCSTSSEWALRHDEDVWWWLTSRCRRLEEGFDFLSRNQVSLSLDIIRMENFNLLKFLKIPHLTVFKFLLFFCSCLSWKKWSFKQRWRKKMSCE